MFYKGYIPLAHGSMVYHCVTILNRQETQIFLRQFLDHAPSLEVQIDSDINQLNAKTPEVGVGEGLQGAWKDFMREERDAMAAASIGLYRVDDVD